MGVGMIWSVLWMGEGMWFGVVCGRVTLLEAGFEAEYGVQSEGNFHQGSDSLCGLWLAWQLG